MDDKTMSVKDEEDTSIKDEEQLESNLEIKKKKKKKKHKRKHEEEYEECEESKSKKIKSEQGATVAKVTGSSVYADVNYTLQTKKKLLNGTIILKLAAHISITELIMTLKKDYLVDIPELQCYSPFDVELYVEKGDKRYRVVQEVWDHLKQKIFDDGFAFNAVIIPPKFTELPTGKRNRPKEGPKPQTVERKQLEDALRDNQHLARSKALQEAKNKMEKGKY